MNTTRIIVLSTAGALALGLTVGGVTTAFATEHSDPKAHHHVAPSVTPVAPVTPAGGTTGGGHHSTPVSRTVVPDDVMNLVKTQYDTGLFPNARFEAVPGTYIGDVEVAGGQAEQYISPDGNVVTVGVAKGSFPAIQQRIAQSATPIPGFGAGVEVFDVHGGGTYTGDYEVFAGGYWFSLTSNMFTSPQAATPMIRAALQTIPQG